MNYKYRFSVFTATYNRGHLLHRVYEDLCNQTFKDFEWVIVDDGSSDNTEEICNKLVAEAKLHINYHKKGRDAASGGGGKHTAWRVATKLFQGRYICGADDDDFMPYGTLEEYDKHWKILEQQSDYNDFWCIKSRCIEDKSGKLVGPELPTPWYDTYWDRFCLWERKGCEMDGCGKVEVFRNEASVPEYFPYEDKVTNYGESLRWFTAAKKYKTRIIPFITRRYVMTEESLCRTSSGEATKSQLYNEIVMCIESINKMRNMLFNYGRMDQYIKYIIKTILYSHKLNEQSINYINRYSDRFMYILLYIPTLTFAYFKK